MVGRWLPPESELRLGLGLYATDAPGLGGTLKERPEDFRVREVSLYPMPDPSGPFVVLRVVSRNWEQHELGQRLASRLGLAPHAIRWAGTKDRRAIAERLASYRGPLPTGDLGLPGVELVEAYRARDGLVLGHHYGNQFDIRLTGVGPEDLGEGLGAVLRELRAFGGLPNYFGPQRFGEVRPVTHAVGRAIVQGDLARAVDLYLTDLPEGGSDRGVEARRAYASDHDAVRALRSFPPEYRFERQLLDHLARGNPPERALRALPRELRVLFVHAFQSLLFNRFLTDRLAEGPGWEQPRPGDHVLRIARDGTIPGDDPVAVSSDNLPEAQEFVRRGRGVVAGPLPGYETPLDPGPGGALLRRLLDEEQVTLGDFRVPGAPGLASGGSWRPLLVPVPLLHSHRDVVSPGETAGSAWRLRFTLPRGSYATVLLREVRKAGATLRPLEAAST